MPCPTRLAVQTPNIGFGDCVYHDGSIPIIDLGGVIVLDAEFLGVIELIRLLPDVHNGVGVHVSLAQEAVTRPAAPMKHRRRAQLIMTEDVLPRPAPSPLDSLPARLLTADARGNRVKRARLNRSRKPLSKGPG